MWLPGITRCNAAALPAGCTTAPCLIMSTNVIIQKKTKNLYTHSLFKSPASLVIVCIVSRVKEIISGGLHYSSRRHFVYVNLCLIPLNPAERFSMSSHFTLSQPGQPKPSCIRQSLVNVK